MANSKTSKQAPPFSPERCESLIQARDLRGFLAFSRRFHPQQTRFTHFTVLLMGFRRMGLLLEGWRFLRQRYNWAIDQSLLDESHHLSLWMGYWLHIMGATELASRAIAHSRPKTLFEVRTVAEIYLTQFRYTEARELFEIYFQMQQSLDQARTYETRLVKMEYADALAGDGYYLEALTVIQKTLEHTPEPLLQAIGHSCETEYWCQLEEYGKALSAARIAETLMPPEDKSIDRLLLTKWKSFADFKANRNYLSYHQLLKCYRRMRQIGLRPEAWLDTLRLLLLCKENPRRLQRTLSYPGIDEALRQRFYALQSRHGVHSANPSSLPYSCYQLVIRWHTGEWLHHQQWHYGFNLEIRCVSYLAQK